MTTETVVSAVFLAVSVTALTVQAVSLTRLRQGAPRAAGVQLAYRGLLRTSTLRVAVATLYTGLGVATLIAPPTTGVLALASFTFTQIIWVLSGVADVRLKRKLTSGASVTGRHRKG